MEIFRVWEVHHLLWQWFSPGSVFQTRKLKSYCIFKKPLNFQIKQVHSFLFPYMIFFVFCNLCFCWDFSRIGERFVQYYSWDNDFVYHLASLGNIDWKVTNPCWLTHHPLSLDRRLHDWPCSFNLGTQVFLRGDTDSYLHVRSSIFQTLYISTTRGV